MTHHLEENYNAPGEQVELHVIPGEQVELHFTPDQITSLNNLGFEDYLDLLDHRTFEEIQNEFLIVLAELIDQGRNDLRIVDDNEEPIDDNEEPITTVQQAMDLLNGNAKHEIADTVLGRLGAQGGKKKKRTNKKRTNRKKSKKRRTMSKKRRQTRRRRRRTTRKH